MDTAAKQSAGTPSSGAIWSTATLEKVVLLGLLSVIFAQTLPGSRPSNLQLFLGVAAVVVVNAAFTLALSRRQVSVESTALAFAARMVGTSSWSRSRCGCSRSAGRRDQRVATLYFLTMISLLTTFHDRWSPIYRSRVAAAKAATG